MDEKSNPTTINRWLEQSNYELLWENTQEPVVAECPEQSWQIADNPQMRPYEELKANLLLRYPRESLNTLLVTGVNKDCGVSTTAANLAVALSREEGRRTLLLEANLRAPSMRDSFQLQEGLGLSELLFYAEHQAKSLTQLSRMTPTCSRALASPMGIMSHLTPLGLAHFYQLPTHLSLGNLFILPIGRHPCDAATFYESYPFYRFLNWARSQFDYIVIDAPQYSTSESMMMTTRVNGVLLIVESRRTRVASAVRAKRQIEAIGGKLLGVVLNKRRYPIPKWLYQRL